MSTQVVATNPSEETGSLVRDDFQRSLASLLFEMHRRDKDLCKQRLLETRDMLSNAKDTEGEDSLIRNLLQSGITVTLAIILMDEETYSYEASETPADQEETVSKVSYLHSFALATTD
ncbi:hypothetical protein K474DRAFT_1498465 [Panus rudis PR-1116 ss-1]|nr:hypothetical protein K474DRAFT_1498465 [Panus rudis PR-1116 ss-1]